jgi:hypothetical protein
MKKYIKYLILAILGGLCLYILQAYYDQKQIEAFNKLQQMEIDSYHQNITNEIIILNK